jgi:hypothetical protein
MNTETFTCLETPRVLTYYLCNGTQGRIISQLYKN